MTGEACNALVFRGDRRIESLPCDNRGLAYGDGLFETMRAHRGVVPWWDAHWSRLQQGAARLRLPLPDQERVRQESRRLLAGGDGVLKLIVTRGSDGRGYAADPEADPEWLLSRHSLPPPLADNTGLQLRWCDTRLAMQPALAGLKHCNRLEQVLARGEWRDAPAAEQAAEEGLMRDTDGHVVCATAANLFLLRAGRWSTPVLDRCGVAGICRGWLLAETAAEIVRMTPQDVESAESLILCNAVRGILPVACLDSRSWAPHPLVAGLQERLARAHPGF